MHSKEAVKYLMIALTSIMMMMPCNTQPTRTRYCGTHLADALKLACGGTGYNNPWADDSKAAAASNIKYIKSLGVATECCYIGCSWRTITSYCAESINKKTKKSIGDDQAGDENHFGDLSKSEGVSGADLAAAAPEIEIENIRRSAPLFGTVSPEYLRLPRTLDEVPPLYQGMQGF